MNRKLLLFTSAYNVEEHIEVLWDGLVDLRACLDRRSIELRVLVIDDKSTDKTLMNVKAMAQNFKGMDVKANKSNLGNAVNIEAGYNWALKKAGDDDLVATLDADGEHNPLAIVRHLARTKKGYDGVIGSAAYPEHFLHPTDRHMMPYLGQIQSALAKADGPFTLQSPGMQIWKTPTIRKVINDYLPAYKEFVSINGKDMPRWGFHGVVAVLAGTMAEAKINSVYLECFGPPPNRSDEKRELQASACLFHQKVLREFIKQNH